MSRRLTRRDFMEKTAAGTAALGLAPAAFGLSPGALLQSSPAMAIARWTDPQEDAEAIRHEAVRLTEAAVEALGGMGRFIARGDVVWVKPNIGWDRRPEQAANTNPDVVATVVRLCLEAGAKKVMLSDSPCNDERRTFVRSGIQEAAREAGAEVFFLDRRKFREMDIGGRSLRRWPVYMDYVECDKRINIPIAKHHNLTGLTLSIKNLMGVLGGNRSQIHQNLGPAMADVARFVPSDLVILDAVRVLTGNGPQGGSLNDVARRDIIAASTDTVAIDAFGTTLFGQPPDRLTTTKAGAALGLGTYDYESLSPVRLDVS
jgi:uncharacterized protein (DUF362 family)